MIIIEEFFRMLILYEGIHLTNTDQNPLFEVIDLDKLKMDCKWSTKRTGRRSLAEYAIWGDHELLTNRYSHGLSSSLLK